jgi:hypothetical protein
MGIDVDYTNHPAFGPHLRPIGDESALAEIFPESDAAIVSSVKGKDRAGSAIHRQLAVVARILDEDVVVDPDLKPFIVAAYERALQRSIGETRWQMEWGRKSKRVSARAQRDAETILDQGYKTFMMPRDALAELRKVVEPDVQRLRRQGVETPDDIATDNPSDPNSTRLLNEFCEKAGIFDAISAYCGDNYRSAGFGVHVSQPRDTWFHVFDDINLPMPKTTQMHFDLAFDSPKAMLYLNDVGENQGPFSLVPKSDPWQGLGSELAFRKELLYGIYYYVGKKFGKSTRGNTPIFRFDEARRAYATLPVALRGTSHPGDHILDTSPLSGSLLKSEIKLTGEAGLMPVFSGAHVLHRGGLVTDGERLALQICFYKSEPVLPPPAPRAKFKMPRIGWGIRGKIKDAVRQWTGVKLR